MQHKSRVLAGVIVTLALMLPALANASPGGATPKPTATARPRSSALPLRLALPDALPKVDPALVADEENAQLAALMYSGLVRLDASYNVVLDAAARYAVSSDHRVYTFYLRKGLRFSNGDPVVADDFRFAIQRSLTPSVKSPSAPTYLLDIQGAGAVLAGKAKTVSGIKVLNSSTIQITARWAVPYFLMELTYPTSFALDEKSITKLGPPDNTSWYSNPVGSGPYRLKTWIPNNKMVLTRNPYYRGTRPVIKTITISLTPLTGQGASLYQYVTHNLDVVSLPAYDAGLLHQPGIQEKKMLSIAGVYMSSTTKPFNNVLVRRALTLAMNRSKIVSGAMGSAVTPFSGYVPPGQAGYDPQLHVLTYDTARARKDLAKAGFPSGKGFPTATLYYGVDPNNPTVNLLTEKLAQSIARSWHRNLHITVSTRQLTLFTLYAKAESNSLPLYIFGWSADYPDAHDWLAAQWRTKALNNNVGYSNPKFDQTVERADVTWSWRSRASLYDTAQQILVQDAAWIPLYIPHRLVYIRPTVTNLFLTGYGLIPRKGSWAQVAVRRNSTKGIRR